MFLDVCIGCPCPQIELSEVEHKALDCWSRLGEWRGTRVVKEGMGLISEDLQTRGRHEEQYRLSYGV